MMMYDVGIEVKEVVVCEVVKLLFFFDLLVFVNSIRFDYVLW